MSAIGSSRNPNASQHSTLVRVTHWLTVVAFVALLSTGAEIVISHPRFYWGETGNVMMKPLFTLPIPSSRESVQTAYGFVMPDQNGWSRYMHFQAAWLLVLTGVVYVVWSVWSGHVVRDLVPPRAQRTWSAVRSVFASSFRRGHRDHGNPGSYNVVQRITYLGVIFVLFPLVIWTGLALSPSFDSAFPFAVNVLGGRQSARTLHFFVSNALVLFLVVHVLMVALAGFRTRMRSMTLGRVTTIFDAQIQPTPSPTLLSSAAALNAVVTSEQT